MKSTRHHRLGWAAAFFALFLLLHTTCVFTAEADNTTRDALLQATVRMRYERWSDNSLITGHGTAFATDLSAYGYPGKRYLLTAAHNVQDKSSQPYATVKIERNDGNQKRWQDTRVVVSDVDLDISIVEVGEDE